MMAEYLGNVQRAIRPVLLCEGSVNPRSCEIHFNCNQISVVEHREPVLDVKVNRQHKVDDIPGDVEEKVAHLRL